MHGKTSLTGGSCTPSIANKNIDLPVREAANNQRLQMLLEFVEIIHYKHQFAAMQAQFFSPAEYFPLTSETAFPFCPLR